MIFNFLLDGKNLRIYKHMNKKREKMHCLIKNPEADSNENYKI